VCLRLIGLEGNSFYYELPLPDKTIDFNLCQHLIRLKQSIQEKRLELINRKGIVFHYDNVKPHIFDDSAKIERF